MAKITPTATVKQHLNDKTLAVVTLNVGDGDAIIIRFPPHYSETINGRRKNLCAVIDCNDADKTIAALKKCNVDELPFICATHPHADHTRGLKKLIEWCVNNNKKIHQFWDSGFRHVSKIHYDLVKLLQQHQDIKFIRPTSGYEWIINGVHVQVLSPSILLKNRYDTFGTNINNASIVIKLAYPTVDIAEPFANATQAQIQQFRLSARHPLKQNTIILGGDAQFDAWARITEEFPELVQTSNREQLINPDLIKHQPLRCQVLKVPHHMSKHGISLEVLETLKPIYSLASCANKSRHGFPHEITVMAAKDIKSKKTKDKGIRYTGHHDTKMRSGTLVTLVDGDGKRPLVYGLGDTAKKNAPLPQLH